MIGDVEPWKARQRIGNGFAALAIVRLLAQIDLGRRGLSGNGTEILPDLGQSFVGIEIADQRENGVVRRVVGMEKSRDIGDAGSFQIGHGPDCRMLVSEVVVRKAVEIQLRAPVRLVVDALAAFLFHGIALVVEIGLRHVKRAHAVGF